MVQHPGRKSPSIDREPAPGRLAPLRAAVLLAISAAPASVAAATIVVTDAGDGPVTSPSTCTLRQAVMSMNASALSGDCANTGGAFGSYDLIRFAPGIDEIVLADAPNNELHVTAAELSIDAGNGRTVSIRRPADAENPFGLIFADQGPSGGLLLAGLDLRNGTGAHEVQVNVGKYQLTAPSGGAIYASGTLWLDRCTIAQNTAAVGGAVATQGLLIVGGTQIEDNSTILNGAVVGGEAYISNSTIARNSGGTASAGLFDRLDMTNSTVSGNVAQGGGASKYVQGGSALIVGFGGSASRIENSTIACNEGTNASVYVNNAALELKNTIVSSSVAGLCSSSMPYDVNSPTSLAVTGAGNIVRAVRPVVTFADATPLNVDPKLLPLGNNHGYTSTHALATDSPAIDAGVATNLTFDQRITGFPRPVGAGPDIGAFEYGTPFDDGACGAATGRAWPTLPMSTPGLCSVGSPFGINANGPWQWLCGDASGGAQAQCAAPLQTTAILRTDKPYAQITNGLPSTWYVFGEPASLEFSVNGQLPLGRVDFQIGQRITLPDGSWTVLPENVVCDDVLLVAATAHCVLDATFTRRGHFHYDAHFTSDDASYTDADVNGVHVFVDGAPTSAAITATDPGTVVSGIPFFVAAQAVALPPSIATPTGAITVRNLTDGTQCVFDVASAAGCDLMATSAGTKSLQASYSFGTASVPNFLPSTSPMVEWIVGEGPPDLIFADGFD